MPPAAPNHRLSMTSAGMSAVISDCGHYRYALWREIPERLGELRPIGVCLFVMLNPSTADANIDDPTITRCIRFAQRWGYRRLAVGNLYAYRATDPRELGRVEDPVGPDNYAWLDRLVAEADTLIVAWGAGGGSAAKGAHVDRLLEADAMCLGTTADRYPKHPLARGRHRVPADFEPIPYRGR
jgi:hypothetical protein